MTSAPTFRIAPIGSRLYFTVRVFPSCAAMRHYARPRRLGVTCRGLATSWTVVDVAADGRERITADAGELLLVEGYLGANVVSHECAHLALAWARRRRVAFAGASVVGRDVTPGEERFCYALGDLVSATYRQLYRRKLVT